MLGGLTVHMHNIYCILYAPITIIINNSLYCYMYFTFAKVNSTSVQTIWGTGNLI